MIFIGYETSRDVVEYPDEGLISVMAKTKSQTGDYLWGVREVKENN